MPGMTIEDAVEKVGPDIEALLADGVPRSKRMITAERPAPRQARCPAGHLRMIVTGRLVQVGIKNALPRDPHRPVERT